MKITLTLLSIFAITASLLTGCQNTASGFGKDMQHNGEALQKTVDKSFD